MAASGEAHSGFCRCLLRGMLVRALVQATAARCFRKLALMPCPRPPAYNSSEVIAVRCDFLALLRVWWIGHQHYSKVGHAKRHHMGGHA